MWVACTGSRCLRRNCAETVQFRRRTVRAARDIDFTQARVALILCRDVFRHERAPPVPALAVGPRTSQLHRDHFPFDLAVDAFLRVKHVSDGCE